MFSHCWHWTKWLLNASFNHLLYFMLISWFLDVQLLSKAFQKLQQNFQVNLVQSKDTIGQDIYVLLAESALDVRLNLFFSNVNIQVLYFVFFFIWKLNANSIADECLQMFFSSSPVRSQFVGRAYLCQFRMYMPKAAQDYVINTIKTYKHWQQFFLILGITKSSDTIFTKVFKFFISIRSVCVSVLKIEKENRIFSVVDINFLFTTPVSFISTVFVHFFVMVFANIYAKVFNKLSIH